MTDDPRDLETVWLDEARVKYLSDIDGEAARTVEAVAPDVLAVREIAARVVEREAVGIVHPYARDIRAGKKDDSTEVQIARAVLAYLKGEQCL